jgi:hypothetical protein
VLPSTKSRDLDYFNKCKPTFQEAENKYKKFGKRPL